MSIQTSEINPQSLSQAEVSVPASLEVQGHEAKSHPQVEDGLRKVIRDVMDKHGLQPEPDRVPEVDPMDKRIAHASRVEQHASLNRVPTSSKSNYLSSPQRQRPQDLYHRQ